MEVLNLSKAVLIGSEIYRNSQFGGKHPLSIPRVSAVLDLIKAIGICDKADNADGSKTLYREWTCPGNTNHFVSQTETSNMGKCNDDSAATATYVWDVCNQNAQSFCEEIKTRAQCEGTPDMEFIDPDDPATLNNPAVKVWTSNGDVTLRHCQSTYVASGGGAANLVPLPTSS